MNKEDIEIYKQFLIGKWLSGCSMTDKELEDFDLLFPDDDLFKDDDDNDDIFGDV